MQRKVITYNGNRPDLIERFKKLEEHYNRVNYLESLGLAVEKVFKKGGWIQIPTEHDIESEKDLLEWSEPKCK